MIVNTMRYRSGLYDVWVYFPRTLISSKASDEQLRWSSGDLSDGHAPKYLGKQEFTNGSNEGCLPGLRKNVPVAQTEIRRAFL